MSAADPNASNPFATRRVRPGAISYRFAAGESIDLLVERLHSSGWRGQIVGPHGAGKSTLLASLGETLRQHGRLPVLFSLHDGQRSLGRNWFSAIDDGSSPVVFVDGYEQLSRWSRFWLSRTCQRHNWGLIVTSHHDVGLPKLYEVQPNLMIVQNVVHDLLPAGDTTLGEGDVAAEFNRHNGNVREALFGLYDLYQQRRLTGPGSAGKQPL